METAPRSRGSLHVAENLRFQHAEWAFQRAGAFLLVLVVAAALLGIFGRGPASSAEASTPDGAVTVEYERFAREGAPWVLHVRPQRAGLGALLLGKVLIDRNEVEQIVPQPDRSRATPLGILLSYDAPVEEVKVRLRPTGPGWFTYTVAPGTGGAIEMRQLVYF